ncbi:MAG: shikimate kinase [Desulfitobacteriaceae bacterium]|nr:shikimate kinase [Desulfitobacteriaceae bacterium]MDD4347145.1 shikimate kinase [Desulfitobacteriaceae bacterium]MDD4401591.1 shikimate kinase [Desulfitobacteriaceae bacterium]
MKDRQNIILIGFMGAGKSTVGKRLATVLHWKFVDTDSIVEEIAGMTISNIFCRYGESRFRFEEYLAVKKVCTGKNCIISTGGGTVMNPENFKLLKQSGLIIYLYASLEDVLQRVGSSDRPLLKRGPEEVLSLWQSRLDTYAQAHYIVDTTNKGVEEVVKEILKLLREGVR